MSVQRAGLSMWVRCAMGFLRNVFGRPPTDEPPRTSWVFCPNCSRDLNGDGESFVSDDDSGVSYRCASCGHESVWCFDAPCPFLLSARPICALCLEKSGAMAGEATDPPTFVVDDVACCGFCGK